jgi:methyl-accepting chemotaxis protein
MFFNKKYKDELSTLKKELEMVQEENRSLTAKNAQLDSQYSSMKREKERLTDKIRDYENSIKETSESSYSEVIHELDSLLKKLVGQDEIVIENINLINTIGVKVKDRARAAGETIENMTRTTKDTSSVINNFTQSFEDLLDRVKSIENISSQINGIASQTQLLSLNASIESARAGEAGRGFTVVAEEIKKLSESTSRLLKDIQDTVKETYSIAVKAKEQAVNLNQGKVDNILVAKEAKQGFEDVVQRIEEITKKITEIKNTGDSHLKLSQNIINKVNTIA